jgi:hypothetical protein
VTNLAGAVGPTSASSEVFQIAANTLNQFGAAGSAVKVLGDYSVTQQFAFGNNDNINVLNSNGAFSSGGFSTAKGSQVIATAINNTAMDNGKGGQSFGEIDMTIAQTYAPSTVSFGPFTATGEQHIDQQNSITAGYNTNTGAVGTGGAAIVGTKLPNTTGTSTTGLQANTFSVNTASVNLLPPTSGIFYPDEDLKLYQSAYVNGDINLFNVADAGAQNPVNPPKPPPPYGNTPLIDPSISNLQQIAVVTFNSATLTGDPLTVGNTTTPASFDLGAAFIPADPANYPTNPALVQTPNQYFAGVGGFFNDGADLTLFNVAHALTWTNGAYTGPGTSDWDPTKGGTGDVAIGGTVDQYGNGGVKQIVALTINSVSGATSQDGTPGNQVDVHAGTYQPNQASITTPPGSSAFWQYADLSNLSLTGRPDFGPLSSAGGAGITNEFVENVNTGLFPSYAGSSPVPVSPNAFFVWDWDKAQNTAIAGTGIGKASLKNVDQVAAVTVNSFSFDNSVTDKTTGEITSPNTDVVSGLIAQDAILSSGFGFFPKSYTLENVAEAVTGKGVATLDTVTQTNVFSVNSFTAGTADFTAQHVGPLAATQTTGLAQSLDTGGAVLNLGNLAVASGTVANVKDTKQINAVSLNTGTIGTTMGGGILQTATGGVNVNAGNYLQATGSLTASISNAQQISVVNVNSITGYAH